MKDALKGMMGTFDANLYTPLIWTLLLHFRLDYIKCHPSQTTNIPLSTNSTTLLSTVPKTETN